ncbi:ER membrane protein complex subunit 1 [Rhynchospora pubera]|uniref:ER membrane protein complex subunit 1 n=1 Tax=Rhynchospora pubera TaxID=906938 RepID=A0AAV8FUG2_9POAL|nr:ER membrane protein complex subunit 1 [Rhynchospora pubera]
MEARFLLGFLLLLSLSSFAFAIYEDQVGLADWHKRYIGKVKHAVFHTQKTGRRRVVVSTEENAIASLDLRTGDILWRHVLGKNDAVDQIGLSLGKYVLTLSSQGSVLRAWNLPDGQMVWETDLQISNPSNSFLHALGNVKSGRDSLSLVCNGGSIRAVSSIDGLVVWKKDLSVDGLKLKHVFQPPESDTIYAIGFIDSSLIALYHINAKTGELLKHATQASSVDLSSEISAISSDSLVALDTSRSNLLLIKFMAGTITNHKLPLSDIVQDFSGLAELIPTKSNDIFVVKTPSNVAFIKVKGDNEIELIGKADEAGIVSDSLTLSEEEQAFAVVHHSNNAISFQVRINGREALTEGIKIEDHRGHVKRVFLNNYVRTDKSHGFRALIVMEDESLLLMQQGEVVWSREDGLASISDAVVAELPVEKEGGVSVVEVEHTLLEWLKGHMLKLKGTLMLSTPDDMAAIQAMHLKSTERNKMTRDHNGFRKLIIVLTRSGKVYALHTGDGRIVWAHLLTPLLQSESCPSPSVLTLRNWRVPHRKALQENPSILLVGRCGAGPESHGFLFIVDSYSGKVLETQILDHSIAEVVPLPLADSSEQKLHLVIDDKLNAHLYPRGSDALEVFVREMANMYYYKVENAKEVIKGYAFKKGCSTGSSAYCFGTRELWSVVFPSDSERIVAAARRKINEVVHTQAKIMTNQDVMYKYISKNILFVATVSPKAAGGIGSAAPDEAWLVAYLIDTVTGRILHRVTHQGAQGPVHAVVSENWVVYHYFNLRAHRYEMTVIEIYDQSRADNKDVMKLVLGKHNLTAPITSYSRPEIATKSQSYFFTHSVKAIAVTTTARGITSKQILIGTIGDQVLALDKRYLDPRRTANPSQEEKEEGIIPLTDTLPIIPQSYVTHTRQVGDLRGIMSFPANLESTTHVFSYGIDLFYTRIAPSRTYDSLTDEFSYVLLLITVVVLIVAILVTWAMSQKKDLQEKWR